MEKRGWKKKGRGTDKKVLYGEIIEMERLKDPGNEEKTKAE